MCITFCHDDHKDFPMANLGLVISPLFSQWRPKFPNFLTDFPMSDSVLYFDENLMKITTKIPKLQLITSRFVVGFDEYFRNKVQNIFNCS